MSSQSIALSSRLCKPKCTQVRQENLENLFPKSNMSTHFDLVNLSVTGFDDGLEKFDNLAQEYFPASLGEDDDLENFDNSAQDYFPASLGADLS